MMKKLYDEGDDEMKRTIAKVTPLTYPFFSVRKVLKIKTVSTF
jgi:hypothetical protein